MKLSPFLFTALFLGYSLSFGQDGPTTLRTLAGKAFENARIVGVLPDGVVVQHAAGVSKFAFTEVAISEEEQAAALEAVAADMGTAQAASDPAYQPRIVTAQDFKDLWIRQFPQPDSLDKDYHQKKKEFAQLVTEIESGALDTRAERSAMEWNIEQYRMAGDLARAESVQADLSRLEARVLKEQKLNLQKERIAATEQMQMQLQMIEQHLHDANMQRTLNW